MAEYILLPRFHPAPALNMTLPVVPEDSRVVHRIFLASPGDLSEERKMVRDLVEELNRVIAPKLGILLELYGWEQQRPRAGRPQAIINPHVDRCHLFIGLLAERWGSPTGADTSGFREEFGRALERRKEATPPEVMLAFRALDAARERDAGTQLKKVLKFRGQMQRERGLLYQTFSSVAELQGKLRDWLHGHLFDFTPARAPAADDRGAQPALPTRHGTALVATAEGSAKLAPLLLTTAADAVSGMLRQTKVDSYVEAGMAIPIEQLLRLRLHVNAWTYLLHHTEPLGMHDHNSLYQIRDQVTLVQPEHALIRTALIADLQDVLPGWYWFQESEPEDVTMFLVHAATGAPTIEARARAIRLLGEAQVQLAEGVVSSLLETAVADDSAQVARSVVTYVRELGDEALLRRLETEEGFADNVTQKERYIALLGLLAQTAPTAAATEAVRCFSVAPAEARQVIEAHAEAVPDAALAAMLSDLRYPELVELGQRIMIRRGRFTEGQVRGLLTSASSRTREVIIRYLIETGGKLTAEEVRKAFPDKPTTISASLLIREQEQVDAEALVLELFRTLPEADLRARLNFRSLDSAIAYRALGLEHFESFAGQVRADLDTGFTLSPPILLIPGANTATPLLSPDQEIVRLEEFVRQLHSEAAVAALAEHGGPDDVRFATALLLSMKYVRDAKPAIRLITTFGKPQDAVTLLAYAERAYGDEAVAAARGAVGLCPGPEGAAGSLLSSSKEDLIRVGLQALRGAGKEAVIAAGEALLGHTRDGVRLTAAALLVNGLEPGDLEEVMRQYRARTTYFYDVGCWLDRVLYAPEPLRSAFRRRLLVRLELPA